MAKRTFGLQWAFDSFCENENFSTRRMFGSLAAYVHGRMVMVLAESTGERCWKGVEYPFDIWHGILLPTELEHHLSLKNEFPDLSEHPVLKKWLYLPVTSPDFEETVHLFAERINRDDERFGIYPDFKKQRKKPRKKRAPVKGARRKKSYL